MVYCVAWGCSNSSKPGKKFHFFKFPSEKTDATRRKVWIARCQRGERDWKPSASATLCSEHFEPSSYEKDPERLRELGYENPRARLKKDALPTKFKLKTFNDDDALPEVTRGAYRKRRTTEILRDILNDEKCSTANSPIPQAPPADYEATEVTVIDQVEASEPSSENVTHQSSKINKKIQVTLQKPQRSRRIQVNVPCPCKSVTKQSVSVQCDIVPMPPLRLLSSTYIPVLEKTDTEINHCDTVDSDSCTVDYSDDEENEEYIPSLSQDSESDDSEETDLDSEEKDEQLNMILKKTVDPSSERQFLVSETALTKLLSVCSQRTGVTGTICGMTCEVKLVRTRGVMVVIDSECPMGHTLTWNSQSMHGSMPWGNLLCASSILFSGGSAAQTLKYFSMIRMPVFSMSTFVSIQKCYAIPTCLKVWGDHQKHLLESVGTKALVLGGDGRCDSPGHSAKYGTYTLMDLQDKKILHIQLVQSNEVKNSHHMELEGLKRGLAFLEEEGCCVAELVTDRHVSVKKYMREEHKDKKHYFDVWHMSKGVGKKLEAASKRSGCSAIHPWVKSATNHMYWVAASCKDDSDLKVDKWLSINNHVANKHDGHSEKFPKCEHGPLDEERLWMKEGSRPYKIFQEIVGSSYLVKDIGKLSPVYQTYSLEVFHNVVNNFAPKNTHYFHASMTARMYLAALHFNENGDREQATDEEGSLRWKMVYPRPKKGESAVVKPIKTQTTFNYADELLETVIERRQSFPTYIEARKEADKLLDFVPQTLTKSFKSFCKEDLVAQMKSRFTSVNKQNN